MQTSPHVIAEREGGIEHVTLDRPKALNSLDLGMCEALHAILDRAADDDQVESVVVTSSGKHFCAGGDIKAIRQDVLDGDPAKARHYFATEYAMNQAVADLPKPYVAVMHGATMGGGLGISMHGAERIVTDTLMTSMPETAIGFVPDVGASWTLPRLCGGGARGLAVALYLGLTGARMGAADALYTGLATRYIRDDMRGELVSAMRQRSLGAAIEAFCLDPQEAGDSALEASIDAIEEVFSAGSVPEMLERLESRTSADAGDEWAAGTLEALRSMSPTSLVATDLLLRHGARVSALSECLDAELRLGAWICARPDFVEGVRAVLVDKSRDAAWSPASVDEVDSDGIRAALAG